jgi:hypothetical protein
MSGRSPLSRHSRESLQFRSTRIGVLVDDGLEQPPVQPGWTVKVSDVLSRSRRDARPSRVGARSYSDGHAVATVRAPPPAMRCLCAPQQGRVGRQRGSRSLPERFASKRASGRLPVVLSHVRRSQRRPIPSVLEVWSGANLSRDPTCVTPPRDGASSVATEKQGTEEHGQGGHRRDAGYFRDTA